MTTFLEFWKIRAGGACSVFAGVGLQVAECVPLITESPDLLDTEAEKTELAHLGCRYLRALTPQSLTKF